MVYKTLKEVLQEKKITQRELGEQLGISESQISLLISGKRQMKLETAFQIANCLKINQTDFIQIFNFAFCKEKGVG